MRVEIDRHIVFSAAYLGFCAILALWFVALAVGIWMPDVMNFAGDIAIPTLLGSVAGMELFKRLARRANKSARQESANG